MKWHMPLTAPPDSAETIRADGRRIGPQRGGGRRCNGTSAFEGRGLLIVMSLGFGVIAQLAGQGNDKPVANRHCRLLRRRPIYERGLVRVGDPGGTAAEHRRAVIRRGAARRPDCRNPHRRRHLVPDAPEPAPASDFAWTRSTRHGRYLIGACLGTVACMTRHGPLGLRWLHRRRHALPASKVRTMNGADPLPGPDRGCLGSALRWRYSTDPGSDRLDLLDLETSTGHEHDLVLVWTRARPRTGWRRGRNELPPPARVHPPHGSCVNCAIRCRILLLVAAGDLGYRPGRGGGTRWRSSRSSSSTR